MKNVPGILLGKVGRHCASFRHLRFFVEPDKADKDFPDNPGADPSKAHSAV